MPEIEREAVLYERAQARLAREERRQLEKKMRELERAASRPIRGPSASMERKRRTLNELKAQRARRRHRREESDSDYHDEDEPSLQEDGELALGQSPDTGTESDVDDRYAEPRTVRRAAAAAARPPAASRAAAELVDLEGANAIRLPRDFLARWIFHPEFDELVRGCLLRLSIGFKGSEQVYRLVEIRKIVKYHRVYKINDVSTNKAAVLKYGRSEKTFRLDVVSNAPFTQGEFARWLETMREEHQAIPTRRSVQAKHQALTELQSRPISDETISAMIAAKRELGAAPRSLVAERTMLLHQREEALSRGNVAEVERIEEELAQVASELALQSQKSAGDSRLEALAELNRRNRKLNVLNAREAERRSVQRSEADNRLDPFSRRKCQPTNFNTLFDSGLLSDTAANNSTVTPVLSEGQASELLPARSPSPAISTGSSPSMDSDIGSSPPPSSQPTRESPHSSAPPTTAREDGPVDLFAAHNVDIDIDI